MTKTTVPLALLAATLVCSLHAKPMQAQPVRVFVAAKGNDGNPCTVAAPCLTFQHAHDTVAEGGEIDVLDPADYGQLTITKSISIQGHGFAGISTTGGGVGIYIDGSSIAVVVNLNGLHIDGAGIGIFYQFGKSLIIQNCIVRNNTSGLIFDASYGAPEQTLLVSNSYFADNRNSGIEMMALAVGSTTVTATIERLAIYGSYYGFRVYGGGTGATNVAVTDSIAAHDNSTRYSAGFSVSSRGPMVSLVLMRSVAVGNGVGVEASGTNATLRIAQSTVTGNKTGYKAEGGGIILSYGDNYIDGNGGNIGNLGSATRQ
jgi:Right handed beta helix region